MPPSRLSGDKSFGDQHFSQTPTRSNSKQAVPQDIDASFVAELGEINDAIVQQVPIQDGIPLGAALVLSPDDDDSTFGMLRGEPESQPVADVRGNSPRQAATCPVRVLPAPNEEKRSKSYDDGTRPLHKLFGNDHSTPDSSITPTWYADALDIPGRVTTKAERRISMNPPPRTPPGDDSPDDPRGRRVSSGSDTSAYYSPKSLDPGRASPSGNQLEANHTPQPLPRSPSASRQTSVAEAPPTKASDSSSFPPRGQSLRNLRVAEAPDNASAIPTPTKPPHEPSVSIEPATDDEAESTTVPPAPSTGGLPSRPTTPNPVPKAINVPSTPPAAPPAALPLPQADEELTPVQPRRVAPPPLVPPALPPVRPSIHSEEFANLLKNVADGSPKVPMPRDSQLRMPLAAVNDTAWDQRNGGQNRGNLSDVDEETPPSPSVLARERIAASQTLPALGPDHSASGGGETSPQCITPTQAGLSRSSPGTAASSPTALTPSLSAPVVLSSITLRDRSGSMPSHTDGAWISAPSGPDMGQHDSEKTTSISLANGHEAADVLRPLPRRTDPATELMNKRLREALADANARGATSLKFDPQFAEALLRSLENSKEVYSGLKTDLDNVRVCFQRCESYDPVLIAAPL